MAERDPRQRIEDLEQRVERLEARIEAVEQVRSPERATFEAVHPVSGPAPGPSRGEPTPGSRPDTAPPTEPAPRPNDRSPQSLEDRLGANWLPKAGVITLVLGVAFFLRFAFENNWIGLTGRIVLGVVGGAALWGLGDWLHTRKRYGSYPEILAGGGAVIVYFTLFAAYAFEDYRAATGMTLELDSALLGLTALGLAGYAVGRDTPTLAALAAGLGALTAIVADAWATFSVTYTVVLGAALIGASIWKRWGNVALATVGATYATLAIDLALGVDPTAVSVAAIVLLALFSVAGLRIEEDDADRYLGGVAVAVGLFTALGAAAGPLTTWAVGLATMLPLALLPAALVHRSWAGQLGALAATFGALTVVLAAGNVPDQVLAASLFATVLFAGAGAFDRPRAHTGIPAGAVLAAGSLAAGAALVLGSLTQQGLEAWRGPTLAAFALAGLGLGFVRSAPTPTRAGWAGAGAILALTWPPVQFDGLAVPLAWATLALAGAIISLARPGRIARLGSGGAVVLASLHLLSQEAPALDDGSLAWAPGLAGFAAVVVAGSVAWAAEHRAGQGDAPTGWALVAIILGLPVVYLGSALAGTWIPIAWAIEALAVVVLGFAIDLRELRLAAFGLFALVLGRVFLVDLAEVEEVYRFVVFLVVGVILLGASFLYARSRTSEDAAA